MVGKKGIIRPFFGLAVCVVMVLAGSVRRDKKVLGHDLCGRKPPQRSAAPADTLRTEKDGTVVVNTTVLARDITGYAGTVPLEIYIKDGTVMKVAALKNQETPEFFEEASVLLERWNGKPLEEAASLEVDAVSGATFTSKAIVGNMRRGLQYARKHAVEKSPGEKVDLSPRFFGGLLVVLMAAILPLFFKNKRYYLVQQVLDVGVLGFWCGSFLSWSSIVGYMSNGMNVVALAVPVVMLVTAFVYPLFGKKSHYCTYVCPFGALQQLAGKCVKRRVVLTPRIVKRLNAFRQILWVALMLCLWSGAWFEWMDYEPFSAFLFQSASWVVMAIAVVFVLLSAVVARPYCRFVCPTGSLFKFSQKGF